MVYLRFYLLYVGTMFNILQYDIFVRFAIIYNESYLQKHKQKCKNVKAKKINKNSTSFNIIKSMNRICRNKFKGVSF